MILVQFLLKLWLREIGLFEQTLSNSTLEQYTVYYPYDFESHKNLSHKQFPISVYYFMDGAVTLKIPPPRPVISRLSETLFLRNIFL